MAERLTLVAEPREVVGKKVNQLRRENLVPAVVYGQREPFNIQMNKFEVRRTFRRNGIDRIFNLEVDGKQYPVLVKDLQKHVTRGDYVHIDFYEVDENTPIRVQADVEMVGRSPLVAQAAGVPRVVVQKVTIEALPDQIVGTLQADTSIIKTFTGVVKVKDVELPEGVNIVADPELVLVRFFRNRRQEVKPQEGEAVVS